jgi:Leucine-rich repeat (LRR) protein
VGALSSRQVSFNILTVENKSYFLKIFLYIGLSFVTAACTLNQNQYDALESIYEESDGANWIVPNLQTKWSFPSSVNAPCVDNWAGIACSCSQQTHEYEIVELSLGGYNMRGIISPSVGNLTSLQSLYLYSNQLSGSIPSTIGKLASLTYLDLNSNELTGSIPPELGQLSLLQELYLYFNHLTASIPAVISQLSSLSYLDLGTNELTGSIPSELDQLSLLLNFYLNSNYLTGSIPSKIYQLQLLDVLDLYSNQLTGSIATEIVQLSLLQGLSYGSNHLTGSIPSEISQLSLLQGLSLGSNHLIGSIPSEIGRLSSLIDLHLDSNQLTGSIPSALGELSYLELLLCGSNNLRGTIPSEIGQLSYLQLMELDGNHLSGSIPNEIGQLSQLQALYLNSNFLSSSLPSTICDLFSLLSLFVSSNTLTSTIPSCLNQMASIQSLALQSNHLSSTIPASLSNLKSLAGILLDENHLSGSFPAGIGSMTSLFQLSLSNNMLTDNILPAISSQNLTTLNIANNLFTGSITDNIFSSGHLSSLLASGNCIFGPIPDTVCNIAGKNLTIFDFSNSGSNDLCSFNQRIQSYQPPFVRGTFSPLGLSGTIPSCLFTSSTVTALRLSGNRFTGTISSYMSSYSINLLNLTLDHNGLTGSIPSWIQTHSFLELDLSYNRLDGTLSSDFVVSVAQTKLGLAVNRLSGELPQSIVKASSNLSSLNVLAGNIFACSNNELPSQDPGSDSYSCASYDLYVSTLTWLGAVGLLLLVVAVTGVVISYPQANVSRYRFYQRLISWSTAISKLFDDHFGKEAGISPGWIDRFHQIPETITFLLLIRFLSRAITCVGILIVFISMPIYIGLHSVSSIVSFDYGYVTSMAYLHNIQPVVFIGTSLLLLFIVAFFFVRSFLEFVDSIRVYYQKKSYQSDDNDIMSVTTGSRSGKTFAWRQHLIFLALNFINLVVAMTVNIAYVNTLVNSTSYNREELLLIQVSVGLFKVVWGVYVSWSCDWLATFSSYRGSMRSRYIMSIINYIIAPVISTIVYSESCFYFVFNASDQVSSSFVLQVLVLGLCGDKTCLTTVPININSKSTLSFYYSYACGESLIVAYTPVLLSSFLFSGVFRPMFQLLLAFDLPISRYASAIFFKRNTMLARHSELKVRVKGRDVVVRLIVHSTVLFTFGLAAPILALPIVFSIVMDCIVCRLIVGKILHENDIDERCPVEVYPAAMLKEQNNENTMNPIVHESGAKTIDISSIAEEEAIKHEERQVSTKADLLTMEHLDMVSSYQAIDACSPLITVFVIQFWVLLFFDMIADVYGAVSGIIAMVCFSVVPASFLIAFDLVNLRPRTISWIGFGNFVDRCLKSSWVMGFDVRRLNKAPWISEGVHQESHTDVNTSRSATKAGSSTHDVEMVERGSSDHSSCR